MRMPSSTGSAPPDRPEPAPRATHGTPACAQARTHAWTSAAEPGSTAARGRGGVLQQPVGLVGAQLVLLLVAPALAHDRAQAADELRELGRRGGGLRLLGDGGRAFGCGV